MYYNGSLGYIVGGLIGCVIFGLITKYLNNIKGYEGGFAWGFWLNLIGVIVVACKPDNRQNAQLNSNVSTTGQGVAEEIKKFKELYDQGIITAEEFQSKKEQLLKLM